MPNAPAPPSATTFTIDQLRLSPHNVRKHRADAEATEALEISILAEGRLLEPVLVHRMRGHAAQWGVFAGGRRYRSIRKLVDRGALPADWPIPAVIHDASDVELVARSLDENLLRRDLQEYETCAAIVRENKLGRSPDDIARRHGQTLAWVQQAMRLGDLAPIVFAAFSEGRLSRDQARAYGATADHELQAAAFEAMTARAEHLRTAAAIRAWLRVDDQEAAKLLRFVGEEDYQAAGGAFEPDLFADGEDRSGRITDEPLLRRLADEKGHGLKEATRARVGRPELRFVPTPPAGGYGGSDWALHVALEEGGELPAGDVVCHIAVDKDGEPDITFWWASRKARDGDHKPPAASTRPRSAQSAISLAAGAAILAGGGYEARRKADAIVKEEAGLTAEGTKILRSLRRAILRGALVDDARRGRAVGLDYLVFAQLRLHLSRAGAHGMAERSSELGMARLGNSEPDIEAARVHVEATEAAKAWSWALRDLAQWSFLTTPDLGEAFTDYRSAPDDVKRLAAAVVAGIAMEPSLDAPGYRVPLHDAIAVAAGAAHPLGLRHWWAPTAAFLELLPIAERRAAAEPFIPKQAFATWAKLKSAELTRLVLRTLLGTATSSTDAQKRAAKQWVHPLLAFDRGDHAGTLAEAIDAKGDVELLEAAE